MKTLADNLYFKNLDNNTGIFHRLLDAAEEEGRSDHRLLLFTQNPKALTASELDNDIEHWFKKYHYTAIDFDVLDAIKKLVDLDMVEISGEKVQAKSLQQVRQNSIKFGTITFSHNGKLNQ